MHPTDKGLFQMPHSRLPENGYLLHTPCYRHDRLNCSVSGEHIPHFGPPPQLNPAWQRPVAALKDDSLEGRLEKALESFLVEHDLLDRVTRHDEALHGNKLAEGRTLCTNTPAYTATVHDLRIRFFEPLTIALLRRYHEKGRNKKERASRGVEFLGCEFVGFDPRLGGDAHDQTAGGITFTLKRIRQRYYSWVTMLSRMTMLFEDDSSFLSFGKKRHLLARGCKFHLYQEDPIPLDLGKESYGAEGILNKLAFLMVSTVERDERTGHVIKLPVRFGMIISTRYVLLAEAGHQSYLDGSYLFRFERRSVTFMFLASILDHLTKAAAPSPAVIRKVFGNTPPDETQNPAKRARPNKSDRSPKSKRSRQCDGSDPSPPSKWVDMWCMKHEVMRVKLNPTVAPAITSVYQCSHVSQVPCYPRRRHFRGRSAARYASEPTQIPAPALEGLPPSLLRTCPATCANTIAILLKLRSPYWIQKIPAPTHCLSLMHLSSLLVVDSAPFTLLDYARRPRSPPLEDSGWWSVPRPPANAAAHLRGQGRRISMPTDQPVILKVFDNQIESGIRESLFHEHVFPLLPAELRALLTRYYGTCRPDKRQRIVLALGYGGRPLEVADMTQELQEKASTVYRLFYRHDINHGDCEARNILLRDDGSLCLIDWGSATLNFSRDPQWLESLRLDT